MGDPETDPETRSDPAAEGAVMMGGGALQGRVR